MSALAKGQCRWLLASLAMTAMFAEAAEPIDHRPRIELIHGNAMGKSFHLRSISYVIDGRPYFQRASPDEDLGIANKGAFFHQRIEPGIHSFTVHLVYEGRSGVFSYVNSYRFVMGGRIVIDAQPDYDIVITTATAERDGLTLAWEQRPSFELSGLPRKSVLEVESFPIKKERLEDPNAKVAAVQPDSADQAAPLTLNLSAKEEAELERASQAVIDEVLAETARQDAQGVKTVEAPPTADPAPAAEEQATADPALEVGPCAVEPITFEFKSTALTGTSQRALEAFGACLKQHPSLRLRLEGHCDQRGPSGVNNRIGQERARSAALFLQQQGLASKRFVVVSYGKLRPVCTEETEACFQRNRRVVFDGAQSLQSKR